MGPSRPFNLDVTLCCGQAFRWNKQGEWWYGVVKDKVFKARRTIDGIEFENVDADFVRTYFGLDDDLPEIYSRIKKDQQIGQAVEMFEGLRILRQDPWECLISYVCATYKSITAIKHMLLNLSGKFGDRVRFEDRDFYAFPAPEQLAKASATDLKECCLGYRAKYVLETAIAVHENKVDLKQLRRLPYQKARAELLNLPGVGCKVADCVLLFSLEKLEAFPIDVWVKRVILKYYASCFPSGFIAKISGDRSLTDAEYDRLSMFVREYFGEYAGYAQEYLYHYERTKE